MVDTIRVMIADDHDVVRRGLSMFLNEIDDLTLAGEAANGTDAIRLCNELQPHVVLLDMSLPDMDGVAVTRAIRMQHPDIQVVILTGSQNDSLVQAALQAGAISYLHKNISVTDMANAIRSAHARKPSLSAEATRSLINLAVPPSSPSQTYNLTKREYAILELMVQGLSNQEIADRLFVSRATVKAGVSTLLSKLGVASRIDAVRLALQESIVK
jgi:two-component system, NarL family, response regulator LiaR